MILSRRRLLLVSRMRGSHLSRNLLVLALGFVLGSCMYITMDKAEHLRKNHQLSITHFVPLPGALRALPAPNIHRKPASHGGVSKSGIPRIIHQTWHLDELSPQLQQWTRTWRLNHMNWDYYYWTQKGGQNLIETKFPRLVKTYVRYPSDVHKVNVHKYAMMYTRGGLIVDADVENMRRVDRLLDTFPCILSLEPHEHNVLLRERNSSDIIVVNSIMACKPRHKFFEIVLNLLPLYLAYALNDNGSLDSVSQSTGTSFLSEALDLYNQVYSDAPSGERVHVLPPSWLMPTYDGVFENYFWKKCTTQYLNLPWNQRKVCVNLVKKNFENVPSNYSFARPHWSRTDTSDQSQLNLLMKLNGFEDDTPSPTKESHIVNVTTKDGIPNQIYGDGIGLVPVTDMMGNVWNSLKGVQNKNSKGVVKEKPWRKAFMLKDDQPEHDQMQSPIEQAQVAPFNRFQNAPKDDISERIDPNVPQVIKDEWDPLNAALPDVIVPNTDLPVTEGNKAGTVIQLQKKIKDQYQNISVHGHPLIQANNNSKVNEKYRGR